MGDRKKVLNLRTSGTTNNNTEISPKLPEPDSVEYGEIIVSYFNDAEALSLKNHTDEIVDFRPNKYYEKKFDEVNQTVEDNELVISASLNDLKTRIDNIDSIPNEYYEKKFDEVNQTIEDNELVISASLTDLKTRIDNVNAIVRSLELRLSALEQ